MGSKRIEIASSPAQIVGHTPMVRLGRLDAGTGAEVYGKLEAYNPAGSVKDRIGVAMIEAAEATGQIEPGRTTVIESTSGNTGIALAFVCAAKGYDLILTMPQGMSRERESLLRLYGADVRVTESMGGMHEAVAEAERLASETPDAFRPDQFSNPANPEVHRRTTAEEIWSAMDGDVDVFVAGVGTGGTITGVGEVLKARLPGVHVVAVEPSGSPVLSGGRPGPHRIQGIGAGFVPAILNRAVIDELITVDDDDAVATAQRLARVEGVSAGISAGANTWAALQVAHRPEFRGTRIVTVICDSGERYISLPFFGPEAAGQGRS
jgi:cysteine synthase A